jgi:hypothetical protein
MVRGLASARWMQANNEVAGNYLQTIGTIYAVLLAFVVFVVWQQHNDFRGAAAKEANDLEDLFRLLQAFPEPGRGRLLQRVDAYRCAVVDDEWAAMSMGRSSNPARQALEEIWQPLAEFAPQTGREEVLYDQVLMRFNELSDGANPSPLVRCPEVAAHPLGAAADERRAGRWLDVAVRVGLLRRARLDDRWAGGVHRFHPPL